MRLVPFLSGQLLGGFAEPFHCFQILPHGFHGKRVHLLSGGQLVDFPLPCLRGYPLAAVFQFFQIPGRCVIQNQFPAVALFKLFPFFWLYFGKLLVDGLVLVVLLPHLPALGLDDLSTQVIVTAVHISDFFMKLLHRRSLTLFEKSHHSSGAYSAAPDGWQR